MNQENIDLVIKCREIIDKHKNNKEKNTPEKMKTSVDGILSALRGLGFNSLQEYDAFDKAMCFEIYKEYRPIKGECDLCAGYGQEPPCKIFYKERACVLNFKPPLDDRIYKLGFAIFTGKTTYGSCPNGHGFKPDIDNHRELPFDITWEVFK